MINLCKKQKNLKNNGFTLLEIVIVIIIVAILAAVGIPKYTGAVEKARASEGTYILGTLLSAQERYFLENNVFASNVADLDVQIPSPKSFNAPTISAGCAAAATCASIKRNTNAYTLSINRDGVVSCAASGIPANCTLAGF
ncbi:MAG: prepilin-type N-terminal cleavage/methylation domain-containing protein [Candidatus Omnitrophota bacterium]